MGVSQPEGCGRPGHRIALDADLLTDLTPDELPGLSEYRGVRREREGSYRETKGKGETREEGKVNMQQVWRRKMKEGLK